MCLIKGIPNIYNEFVVWFMSGCFMFQVQKKWLFVIEEDRGILGRFIMKCVVVMSVCLGRAKKGSYCNSNVERGAMPRTQSMVNVNHQMLL